MKKTDQIRLVGRARLGPLRRRARNAMDRRARTSPRLSPLPQSNALTRRRLIAERAPRIPAWKTQA